MDRRGVIIARRDLAIAIAIAVLIGLVVLLAGCGSDSPQAGSDAPVGRGSLTRDCDTVFDGPGPADWRRGSTWTGSFGLAGPGPGPDFGEGVFEEGRLTVKTPTMVAGHRPVTISLPSGERERAGILAVRPGRAYASVTYVPCEDKPRTVFAAGFLLADRQPVTLLVKVGDGPVRRLSVGDPAAVLRDAVVRGALHDFHSGTEAGPAGFDRCLAAGLRARLTRSRLEVLSAVHERRFGGPFTVQALARLAVPIGDRCGGRQYVPELIFAAHALHGSRLRSPGATRLGIDYGPYLGITCPNPDVRRPVPTSCDAVGIDVALSHRVRGVRAVVGGRPVDLRTPGLHSGVRGQDWVGHLEDVGLERPDSPFHLPGRAEGHWAGYPPVYLPVRLLVEESAGRVAAADLPRVFLSPGWG